MKEELNSIIWAHDQLMELVGLMEMTKLEAEMFKRRDESVRRAINRAMEKADAVKEGGEKG